jgi:hypothetical protein
VHFIVALVVRRRVGRGDAALWNVVGVFGFTGGHLVGLSGSFEVGRLGLLGALR